MIPQDYKDKDSSKKSSRATGRGRQMRKRMRKAARTISQRGGISLGGGGGLPGGRRP